MNILIVKTSAIGDVVHTLPALNALRRNFPEARIDWLVEEAASEVVLGHGAVSNVLISKRKKWIEALRQGKFIAACRGFRDFIRELRATEYDLLIDFQSLLKSAVFVALARARRKVGFGRGMEHAEYSYLFLNERIAPVAMDQHASLREMQLLAAIGVESPEMIFAFPVSDMQREEIARLLEGAGVDLLQTMVAINPMTTWDTKHWYGERFAAVADHLVDRGFAVVFTGGPGDVEAISGICAAMRGRAVNCAGKTTLKGLAALYQRAALLITTDTGPMHLAAAVGTPVVALFGPTAPWRTGPIGPQHRVLRRELACSPCLKKSCEHNHECMDGITVDMVLQAGEMVLSGRTS